MEKIERLIKLAAYLLDSDRPVTLERLRETVYCEYGSDPGESDSLRRMFERDKDELREIGVEISFVNEGWDDCDGYIIKCEDYYLPSIELMPEERVGINMISKLFLGSGTPFSNSAHSALLKLEFDDICDDIEDVFPVFHWVNAPQDGKILKAVIEGITKRKFVDFSYRSLNSDEPALRTVAPYGLFNRQGSWYLIGLCRHRGEIRSFKFDRIESMVNINQKSPHTPDFEVPSEFDLQKEACWEWPLPLGAEDVIAHVRFKPPLASSFSGPGVIIDHVSSRKDGSVDVAYIVGDPEEFIDWVLEFGENAQIFYPEELVEMVRNCLIDVLRIVGNDD